MLDVINGILTFILCILGLGLLIYITIDIRQTKKKSKERDAEWDKLIERYKTDAKEYARGWERINALCDRLEKNENE